MRSKVLTAAAFIAIIANTPAWAGWGCLARATDRMEGLTWGAGDRETARKNALKYCADGDHKGCRIIDCRDNIDTQEEAYVAWPGPPITKCLGGRPDQCKVGQ